MPYSYKYVPKGPEAETLTTWLRAQKHKSKSLNLLILRAINEFGYDDLDELTTNAFLNNQIPHISGQNQVSPTPQPNPTPQPEVKPQANLAPTSESSNSNPEPTNNSNSSSNKKPNISFLSH